MVTMNKAKYEGLPEDLKQVIDDNSGMALSKKVGAMWDKTYSTQLQAAIDQGDEVVDILDPLNDPDWKGPLEKGTKKYLDDVFCIVDKIALGKHGPFGISGGSRRIDDEPRIIRFALYPG